MALTAFQSSVLRLLADNRRSNAESYVAGGLALNYKLGTPRVSRDIDVFHDSEAALLRSWESDSATLAANGFAVKLLRKYASFVEADVSKGNDHLEMQWGWDSAYRFFPLQDDPVAGSTLHPLDLATNKLAALVRRTEVRDWIDVITCAKQIQPLAFLFSAACGKDPGFSPVSMLEYVARRRHCQAEVDAKIIPGGTYDVASLSRFWHEEIDRARETLKVFPREEAGKAVLTKDGELFRGTDGEFLVALSAGEIVFHEGHLGGAWPRIVEK